MAQAIGTRAASEILAMAVLISHQLGVSNFPLARKSFWLLKLEFCVHQLRGKIAWVDHMSWGRVPDR